MLEFTVIYGGMLLVSEVLTYNDIHGRIKTILDIMEKHEYKPDRIIGITRGGLIPAVTMSHLLDIPMEIVSVSFRDGKCNENIPELVKELNYFVPPVKPDKYVTRLSNQLELHGKAEEVAYKILKVARKLRLTLGRGAKGVAAGASYMASKVVGQYEPQREVAETMDITEVTLRNRCKEMMERLLIVVSL